MGTVAYCSHSWLASSCAAARPCGSDKMMISARLDDSAAAPGHSQAALAALLEDGVTGCTAMLTSTHAAFSMAATSRMFYLRARFYTRQREISYALTDLAFAQSLNPLDDEV